MEGVMTAMAKRSFCIVAIVCIFSAIFSPAFASEVTVFGPTEYMRTTDLPNVYTDTFSAFPNEGILIIENGDEDGKHRVTSALVFINGAQIFAPDDFKRQVYLMEAQVDLSESNNSIVVELRSNPGTYLTIRVIQETDIPTVTIKSDPETICVGESSLLTWGSTNADSCVIEPDIGSVEVNGSITVSPTKTTTYTITASNPVETATASITVTVIALNVSIISPLDGATISRSDIMVKGAIANPLGSEVGITVNGIVAMVAGDQFVTNHVPLEEGANTITATAMDWEGNMASASITVYAEPEGEYIMITADDESGTSPFETTLRIEGSFSFTDPCLTCTGPGMVEFLGSSEENEYELRITGEGVYYCTAKVNDTENNLYTDTIAVVVVDQAELDALLKAKWEGMKTALVDGDIEKALSYHHEAFKDRYESIYNLLGNNLSILAQQMQGIEMIFAEGNRAKYRINRDHDIDGQIVTITYFIYFSKDEDGLWKIERY
jgi:hypothetical protein